MEWFAFFTYNDDLLLSILKSPLYLNSNVLSRWEREAVGLQGAHDPQPISV